MHDRIDHAAAQISATLVAIASRSEQSVADFLPYWTRKSKPEQSVDEMMARFEMLNRNGEDTRRG